MIRWRKAAIDDAKLQRIVAAELIPQTRRLFPTFRGDKKTIAERLDRGLTFVAQEGRQAPLGFITFLIHRQDAYVDMLAVEGPAKGRGIGTKLLAAAESHARAKGCMQISLYVEESNESVRRFYINRGYFVLSHVPRLGCHFLIKPLA